MSACALGSSALLLFERRLPFRSNLSVHARKLEDANYVVCTKSFAGRVPRTEYRITSAGRKALEQYLDHMEQIIQQTRGN